MRHRHGFGATSSSGKVTLIASHALTSSRAVGVNDVESKNGIRLAPNPVVKNLIQYRSVTTTAITTAIAAPATTTSASTASTAVFTTRTTVATTSTTTPWRAIFAWARNVDGQSTTVEFLAVQGINGLLRFFRAAHGDERKATGATRHAIHHQVCFHDRAASGKRVLEVVFSGFEGEISNKQLRAHVMFLSETYFASSTLFPTAGFQIITEPSSLEDLPCRGSDKPSIRRGNYFSFVPDCKSFSGNFFRG